MEEKKTFGIQFPRELADRVERYGEKHERSKGYVVRKAVERFLDEEQEERRGDE